MALLGEKLLIKKGIQEDSVLIKYENPETLLTLPVYGLLFSANWCPPCVGFLPILKDFYDQVNREKERFQIVYVSLDISKDQYNEHLHAIGNWMIVPFGDPLI